MIGQAGGSGHALGVGAWEKLRPIIHDRQHTTGLKAQEGDAVVQLARQPMNLSLDQFSGRTQEAFAQHGPATAADTGKSDFISRRFQDTNRCLSELRLVKDAFEIAELRKAVDATALGFDDVIGDLDRITTHPRGERLVEGVFNGVVAEGE